MDAQQRHSYNQTSYITGNTARKLSAAPEREYGTYGRPQPVRRPEPLRREQQRPEKRPQRRPAVGRGIDFFAMVFLVAIMAVTFYVCFNYITAQASLIQMDKKITALEAKLQDATDKNDAAELALNQAVDLDEIYKIAVGELGMVHPNNNTIIGYEKNDVGYAHQYDEIPAASNDSILDKIKNN